MFSPAQRLNITHHINQFSGVVSPIVKELNLDPIIQELISNVNGTVTYFKRLKWNSCLYITAGDCTGRKSSSFVMYTLNDSFYYGDLQAFLKVTQCHCSSFCDCFAAYRAVIRRLVTNVPFKTFVPASPTVSVLEYSFSNLVDIVNVSSLCDVCVNLKFNDKSYIVKRPYRLNLQ